MAAVPSRSQAELRTVGDRGHKLHLHPGPHLSAGAEWSTARGLPKGSQGAVDSSWDQRWCELTNMAVNYVAIGSTINLI